MTAVGVFGLSLVLCSAAVSLILVLPVVVAAESLSRYPSSVARRFWLVVNVLPLLAGLALTVAAFATQSGEITASPHQAAVRPHLCVQRMAALPDAPFRLRLYALMACGLLVYALVRFVVTLLASRSAERLAHKLVPPAVSAAQTPVLTIESADSDCFSLGLARPVVIMTTGLRAVLDEPEIEAVLAHEQCHVRQRDNPMELLVRLASDPLVWLPVTHYYLHALRGAVEQTCDAESAQAHSVPTVIAALRKMEAVKKARQLKLRGDLAQLRPTFPGYANPEQRVRALSDEQYPSLALPLYVVIGLEALVLVGVLAWLARPLHDTLYCAVHTLLGVLRL